jgi:hypothetical protein
MSEKCGTCGTPENFPEDSKSELRPYGTGGSFICFRCAFKDEESEAAAKANFLALSDAAEAMSPVVALGNRGPDPV